MFFCFFDYFLIFFFLNTDVMGRMYWNSLLTGYWNGPEKVRILTNPMGNGVVTDEE
jgi:hypothetical protein